MRKKFRQPVRLLCPNLVWLRIDHNDIERVRLRASRIAPCQKALRLQSQLHKYTMVNKNADNNLRFLLNFQGFLSVRKNHSSTPQNWSEFSPNTTMLKPSGRNQAFCTQPISASKFANMLPSFRLYIPGYAKTNSLLGEILIDP